ncbi:unnamed protein product [Chrysoparadoxa australica]
MSDKIKLEILGLSSSQSQSGSFALVLGEAGGNKRLPIIIGMFEAQAIAIEIEKIAPNRPMTHDLFKSFAYNFDFDVKEIIISDLKEGVFFSKIICAHNNKKIEIDARPSDAIAIGLRFNVEIFTYEAILTEAGIEMSEEEISSTVEKKTESPAPTVAKDKPKKLEDLPSDQLNKMLDDSLKNEDYERAAKIRDEINRRN